MRRALYLFAAVMVGAVSTASAQAHVRLSARLQAQPPGPPNLVVHLAALLDDPAWRAELEAASTVRIHWTVTLYRSNWLIDAPQVPIEWDDDLTEVPVLGEYHFVERTPRGTTPFKFGTLDSLKMMTEREISLPTSPRLAPGKWYYGVTATITTVADLRSGAATGFVGALQRLVLGGGPRVVLTAPNTVTFTVPKR